MNDSPGTPSPRRQELLERAYRYALRHGLGGRLVDECMAFARSAGYTRMTLWTNDPLVAARRVYLSRGFTLVGQEPHHSFGVDLVGQTYQVDLVAA